MNERDIFPSTIEEQFAYFQRRATERPGPNDQAGMVGFGATLLAYQLWSRQQELKCLQIARVNFIRILQARKERDDKRN